jgi:TPR repeat protein
MRYIIFVTAISLGIIFNQPLLAQTTYPVTDRSGSYPLKTQVSPTLKAEIEKIFKNGKFDANLVISLRKKLQPLANNNDPIACYFLAKTYDLYEFGVGKEKDRATALKWYRRSAELNYFPAAYLLYQTYFYRFMGVKTDYAKSIEWLNKSLSLAATSSKAEVLLDFARLSDPDNKDTPSEVAKYIPKSMTAHLAYLQQAYTIDPRNTTIVDWYGDRLYVAKRYAEALKVLVNSDNAYTWQKIGKMYELGQGTTPDLAMALIWYKKMAIDGKKQENDLNPISEYGKYNIYRLICLKQVTPQQATPVYTPEDYQQVFGRWADRECNTSRG